MYYLPFSLKERGVRMSSTLVVSDASIRHRRYDAGNVWLRQENDALPGGAFSSNFLNELGVGTGFGLRVDIQNFVIRGDLAAPLPRPSGLFDFEVKQPIFNFAIGYPF